MGSNTFKEYLDRRYPNITIKGEDKFPNLSRFLNSYDRLSLHKLSLNTVGQVIALKMLNKIFGNLPLKSCLV